MSLNRRISPLNTSSLSMLIIFQSAIIKSHWDIPCNFNTSVCTSSKCARTSPIMPRQIQEQGHLHHLSIEKNGKYDLESSHNHCREWESMSDRQWLWFFLSLYASSKHHRSMGDRMLNTAKSVSSLTWKCSLPRELSFLHSSNWPDNRFQRSYMGMLIASPVRPAPDFWRILMEHIKRM